MTKNYKTTIGAATIFVAFLILIAISTRDKVYDIPGEEVITITPVVLSDPYLIDTYESAVTPVESWEYLVADTTPLLEIEPMDEVIYDYILDEQLTELPPLHG